MTAETTRQGGIGREGDVHVSTKVIEDNHYTASGGSPPVRIPLTPGQRVEHLLGPPTPIAKTTDGRPVFDMSRPRPPAKLGPGEYLNDRGMRTRDGRLVCQFCGRSAKFGWTYGSFGEVTLATCGRCLPDATWTEGIEYVRRKTRRHRE